MKSIFKVFLLLLLSVLLFSACNSPMGMGEPIDWEPPVLTMDPKPPTPMYVKYGAQLTCIATDNDVVDRVILRDSTTGNELFRATPLPNNRYQIELNFSSEQNGETILADVVAYDRGGNSGSESIASVVLIIDIRPPIVEDIWIQRSSTKRTDIEKYLALKELEGTEQYEGTDPNGEVADNVNRYQNGAFHIKAQISEVETRIETVFLELYDSEHPNTKLFSIQPDAASSVYNPQWLITEDMILDAGVSELNLPNYKKEYKNNNKRYYYRLRIVAYDSSGNDGYKEIIEDQEYLCLWQKADYPKGYLDPLVVGRGKNINMTKGSALPVIFFDDDKLDWAYAALFTKEQWAGLNEKNETVYIAPGVSLSGTDDVKFETLKTRLLAKQDVYNWRYDRYDEALPENKIINLIPNPVDDKIHYVITGNNSKDYGEFIFVTLVKDLKQSPHNTKTDPNTFYQDVTSYNKYFVNLVDENAPLIVFDKANGSPEENTFPTLTPDGNFKIFGYTLREDKTGEGLNYVKKFGLAWIPFNINNNNGGPEENIKVVKDALAGKNGVSFPVGVQWWDLSAEVLKEENNEQEEIANINFKRQRFSKTFSILGAEDVDKSEYDNFTKVKGDEKTFENTTKLFVFYAEDNIGNIVYTQFYLLGNKTPPTISIFDITDDLIMPIEPPSVYTYSSNGDITPEYKEERKVYNENSYPTLKDKFLSLSEPGKTETFKVYPRGTIVKFFAVANKTGDLSIKEIKMEDITYEPVLPETKYPELGFYKDSSLGYVEYFPEVSQRVFLFTATDSLGNSAQIQRTIAIANAATLTSITTAEQNGTYPANKNIQIKANFDGMIKLQSNAYETRPQLNILFSMNTNSGYVMRSLRCEPLTSDELANGTLSLVFNFTVPVNAKGRLETIYMGIPNKPSSSIDRPITLTSGNNIIDVVRGDVAYTPGNVTGFFWNSAAHSLQDPEYGKNINLDGEAPIITDVNIVNTKAEYSANLYYFKSGESLSFEITASKPLKVSGNTPPSLEFKIQRANGSESTSYLSAFEYRKVTADKILFTLDVNGTNIKDDGKLIDVKLYNGDNITDNCGNPVDTATFNTKLNMLVGTRSLDGDKEIYFDLTPPKKPVTTLTPKGTTTPVNIGSGTNTLLYNTTPYMIINNALLADEPNGIVNKQYSLDGGLKWINYPDAEGGWTTPTGSPDPAGYLYITNGQWNLRTRYIDKAGNEGETSDRLININSDFPKLIGVNVKQPNATYIAGNKLEFTLDFDDVVIYPAGLTLTLQDLSNTTHNTDGTSLSYQIIVSPLAAGQGRTVTFTWNLASNTKDMLNGLKITAVNISGLKDLFGNNGPAVVSATETNVTVGTNVVNYSFSGIKVSTIKPTVTSREPQNAQGRSGNITASVSSISSDNKTIKLTFSKPVQKGNGTITVRPHGNYAIPAVFENDGYYIAYTYDGNGNVTGETRSSTVETDSIYVSGIYVSGFYDLYNKIDTADRNTLIGGTMSAPALSNVTGLSVGPYLKTTHGLTQGAGYTGNYGNPNNPPANNPTDAIITLPGINAPGTRSNTDNNADKKNNFMIPDVETKWVLAYGYGDLFSESGVVSNIRAILDKAKFRWQEIAVTNTNVTVSGSTVTITLSEPLPPGLQWDVSYTEGTFTDTAGNKAVGEDRGNYWFWSKGVQKPVIRVDRKSFDARAGGSNYSGDIYNTTSSYNKNGYNGDIGSFNTINYRITSETPHARIEYDTKKGNDFKDASNQVSIGSITAAWTGRVTSETISNITNTANITWNGPKNTPASVIGTWVRPNLIFRNTTGTTYYIMEEGINISKVVRGDTQNSFAANNGNYYGFRSYNKDATFKELDILTPNNEADPNGNSFTYDSGGLEASKNYVVAQARIDHVHTGGTYTSSNAISSMKGFEGVFRTVIAFNQSGLTGNGSDGASPMTAASHPILLDGSNVRSGMPTISGFPVRDNGSRTDARYTKVFYRDGKYFYWVSSEIISPWYIQPYGRGDGGGGHGDSGDIEDWITAGYGDLTYVLNLVRS